MLITTLRTATLRHYRLSPLGLAAPSQHARQRHHLCALEYQQHHPHQDERRRRLRLKKTVTQLNFRKRSSSSTSTSGRSGDVDDMSWRSHGRDNDDLVEALKRNKIVKSKEVEVAMKKVDRIFYTKDKDARSAYTDAPQAIGNAATISAPHMHAYCLELLKDHLRPGMKALDVGSGSGYLTSVFAHMVAPEGKAIGVEHIPELVKESRENVRSDKKNTASLLESGIM